MISRTVDGHGYTLSYDAENRLLSVSGSLSASFVYDGDGNRVRATVGGTMTTFVGNYYEVSGSAVTKYYYAGSQRIAMSVGRTVHYLLSDQLGSTSVTTSDSGNKLTELGGPYTTRSSEAALQSTSGKRLTADSSNCDCIVKTTHIQLSGTALRRIYPDPPLSLTRIVLVRYCPTVRQSFARTVLG